MEDFLNISQTYEYPAGKAAMFQAEKRIHIETCLPLLRVRDRHSRIILFCERWVMMRSQFNARELN